MLPTMQWCLVLLLPVLLTLGRVGWYDTQASSPVAKAESPLMNWGPRCTPLEARNSGATYAVEILRRCGMKYPPFWET